MGAHAAPGTECIFGHCDGSGWMVVEEPGQPRRVKRCGCWLAQHQRAAAGVPEYFTDSRLTNFRSRPGNATAIERATAWIKADAGDLYLCGGTGVGKTRLACALLNERFAQLVRTARFVRVPYLMLLQLQGFDDSVKKAEANALLDQCIEAEVLCLDDVAGAEKASDFSRGVMVTMYDQRLDRGLRTIWTSNVNLRGLSTFFNDERLASRIAGACGAEVIEIGGDDYRLEGTRY
jgi:DNA replication protein DnaC